MINQLFSVELARMIQTDRLRKAERHHNLFREALVPSPPHAGARVIRWPGLPPSRAEPASDVA